MYWLVLIYNYLANNLNRFSLFYDLLFRLVAHKILCIGLSICFTSPLKLNLYVVD